MIKQIIWLDEIVEKLAWKHHVTPFEVEEVLKSKSKFFKAEKGKVENEDVYNALGKTEAGRYLSVFYIKKINGAALIISARDMSLKERKKYAKK